MKLVQYIIAYTATMSISTFDYNEIIVNINDTNVSEKGLFYI